MRVIGVFIMMMTVSSRAFMMTTTMMARGGTKKVVQNKPVLQLRGNQGEYVKLLKDPLHPVVVATGVAGTGKTMLACMEAVRSLKERRVDKIVITRPTVASDEELGFLPGSLEMKMAPWMRPVMDYLGEVSPRNEINTWISNGMLEISPLCFMRGRTFKNSFIIGDECQNLRPSLMKMLLTRLGMDSKMVIVGDLEQTDLDKGEANGLYDFTQRYEKSPKEGIGVIHLNDDCVVRHPILPSILDLYKK